MSARVCGTKNHNDYLHLETEDPSGDNELVFALLRLDRFKAQGEICLCERDANNAVLVLISSSEVEQC